MDDTDRREIDKELNLPSGEQRMRAALEYIGSMVFAVEDGRDEEIDLETLDYILTVLHQRGDIRIR